jgi:putative Mg2+ transporter-C (MgtC) family protein
MDIWAILLRTVASVAIGGVIGPERQNKRRPAGFRTNILVCLGASVVMMLSEYLFRKYYVEFNITSDPARLGAQVISGIGFLCAGTIIHYGGSVSGLTTAAGLWANAAIGLCVGAGFFEQAFIAAGVLLLTLLVFNFISRKIDRRVNVFTISILLINKTKIIGKINLFLADHLVRIIDMKYAAEPETVDIEDLIKLTFVLRLDTGVNLHNIISGLILVEGVVAAESV